MNSLAAALPDPDRGLPLDDRVLRELESHPGRIAFNGLRRSLRAHPESLTRTLRRLERQGLIDRADGGYALRDGPDPTDPDLLVAHRTIASVQVPPTLPRPALFGTLAGRWFGPLRWVGVYEHPGDPWLVWSVAGTTGHVMLRLRAHRIEVLVEEGDAAASDGSLEEAARDLLSHSLERLRALGERPRPLPKGRGDLPHWPVDVTEFRLDRSISSYAQ